MGSEVFYLHAYTMTLTIELRHNRCSKYLLGDFIGGPVVKNPTCSVGDVGSISACGTKIPHALEHLSLGSAITESMRSGAHGPQLESLHDASCVPQLRPNAAK